MPRYCQREIREELAGLELELSLCQELQSGGLVKARVEQIRGSSLPQSHPHHRLYSLKLDEINHRFQLLTSLDELRSCSVWSI